MANKSPTALQMQALAILRAAAAATIGVLVRSPSGNALRCKQVLLRFRRESGDVDLQKIHIRHGPTEPTKELYLINMKEPDGAEDL